VTQRADDTKANAVSSQSSRRVDATNSSAMSSLELLHLPHQRRPRKLIPVPVQLRILPARSVRSKKSKTKAMLRWKKNTRIDL
jgi:hypothetical protein